MDVGAEEEAVRDVVSAAFAERLDVRDVEHGERVLAAHGAGAVVRVGDGDAERPLAEAGHDRPCFRASEHEPLARRPTPAGLHQAREAAQRLGLGRLDPGSVR